MTRHPELHHERVVLRAGMDELTRRGAVPESAEQFLVDVDAALARGLPVAWDEVAAGRELALAINERHKWAALSDDERDAWISRARQWRREVDGHHGGAWSLTAAWLTLVEAGYYDERRAAA